MRTQFVSIRSLNQHWGVQSRWNCQNHESIKEWINTVPNQLNANFPSKSDKKVNRVKPMQYPWQTDFNTALCYMKYMIHFRRELFFTLHSTTIEMPMSFSAEQQVSCKTPFSSFHSYTNNCLNISLVCLLISSLRAAVSRFLSHSTLLTWTLFSSQSAKSLLGLLPSKRIFSLVWPLVQSQE